MNVTNKYFSQSLSKFCLPQVCHSMLRLLPSSLISVFVAAGDLAYVDLRDSSHKHTLFLGSIPACVWQRDGPERHLRSNAASYFNSLCL